MGDEIKEARISDKTPVSIGLGFIIISAVGSCVFYLATAISRGDTVITRVDRLEQQQDVYNRDMGQIKESLARVEEVLKVKRYKDE